MFALFAMISAVSAVFAMSAMFRQSRAKGDGKGENDRKERFHSTKYSFLPRRMRLSGAGDRRGPEPPIQAQQTPSAFHRCAQRSVFRRHDALRFCGRSIVSFDRPFYNLVFLNNKFREMLLYVVRSQAHRLINTGFVLKDADGCALARTSIKPIVAHKPLRLLNHRHEVLTYSAVDLCTVLRIKVVVANDSKHNTSP